MIIVIAQTLLWISLSAILHTYIFYPLLVVFLSGNKKDNNIVFTEQEELPCISIIMAVHNEEKIISKKIESVLQNNYPHSKITFYIGSDASTDRTDLLVKHFEESNSSIKYKRFENRTGKVHIINELALGALGPVLVFTDANAIFEKNALTELVKHFKNLSVKVVGGRLHNQKSDNSGIVFQEHTYMENEFKVKIAEGRLWGSMMGAYGAFYAIRKEDFSPVPAKFIADDFYISLKAIINGGKAICEENAIAFEDVSGDLLGEFKRKSRIATGNFQNLIELYPLLFSKRFGLAFSFFSHKVLRWLGPIFILMIFFCTAILFRENYFYSILLILILLSLVVPIIDYFNRKSRIHVLILRFITHFYYMNAALLIGLFNFMKGVKSNVWEPTKR